MRAGKIFFAAAIAACFSGAASAAPEMIVLSSATYDSGGTDKAFALAADADGNIFLAGTTGNDYLSQKYSKALVVSPSAFQIYTNGRANNNGAQGLALDGLGYIVVTGEEQNASGNLDYLTLKYSPNFAAQLSSASYNGGSNDSAAAVKTDSQNNIFVTGYTDDAGNKNVYTIKYSPGLTKLSTAAYDGTGLADQGAAMAIDHSDNIIIAGYTQAATKDLLLLKYDNGLHNMSPVIFDSGFDENASGVAVDGRDNIIVTGRQSDGVTQNFLTLKYDTFLNLVSSAVYDSTFDDIPTGVAVDSDDNIIVTGYTNQHFFTVKYKPDFTIISTAAYNGGILDHSNAVAVDADNNVIVTGESDSGGSGANYFTIKYNASPKITAVSPLFIGKTSNVTISGKGLLADTAVSFEDANISTGAFSIVSGQITLAVTPSTDVVLGVATVTVTNSNGEAFTSSTLAYTRLSTTVPSNQPATIDAMTKAGGIAVNIPSASFPYDEQIVIYTVPVAPGDVRQVGEALYFSVGHSSQPAVNVSIKLRYSDADLGSYSPSLLSLAYWDAATGWVSVTSSVNSTDKSVTGFSKAVNTKYAIVKQAEGVGGGGGIGGGGPGGSGIPAKVFPNPYRPGSGGSFGQSSLGDGVVFAGLAAGQSFKLVIVDLAGQLVYQKSAAADSNGMYLWDTKTVSGGNAATGVYIYLITGGGQPKKGKFSIIR